MRLLRATVLLVVAGGLAVSAPAFGSERLGTVPGPISALVAPAYDASAGSDLRSLAVALQSYAMVEGDLESATAQELVGWGWTASPTTAVVVLVDGERFVAYGRDVRSGATTLQVTSDDLAVRAVPRDRGIPDGADGDLSAGLQVVAAALP